LLNKLRRSPLVVPQEYFEDVDRTYKLALTMKGEAWARHELKKISRAEVEFWGKLILPVLALVISIVALVHKTR
jgi:lipopolysaccharide export LptBFGC system permease protein LptF